MLFGKHHLTQSFKSTTIHKFQGVSIRFRKDLDTAVVTLPSNRIKTRLGMEWWKNKSAHLSDAFISGLSQTMHHLLMEFSSRSDDDTPTKWDYFEIMSFIEILPQQVHKLIRQKKRFFVDPVCTKLIRKNTFSVIPLVHKLCDEKHSSVLPYEQTCTLK